MITTLVYLFAILIILLPVMVIASALRKGRVGICPHCGFYGHAKRKTRGSFALEVILWLAFILPGFIYSIWRITSRQDVCPSCDQPGLIPLASPRGQQLMREYGAKPQP